MESIAILEGLAAPVSALTWQGDRLADSKLLYGALPTSSLVKELAPAAPATTIIVKTISGDNRIDPLLDDASYRFNFASPVGTPAAVTFSFPATLPAGYTGGDANGWMPFNDQQKAATRDILALVQKQVNVTFTEVADTAASFGVMRFSNNIQASSGGYAIFPNSTGNHGDSDTFIAIGHDTDVAPTFYNYDLLIHEIGHAIGLNHPGNYNAGEPVRDVVGNYLGVNEDAFFNSIMSYRQSAQGINHISFMPYDMLALRYLYGATKFETGNNTYKYTDKDGTWVNNIVDDGGVDTLDFSAVTLKLDLDMAPGAFSSVGGKASTGERALANLTISFDAVIENAIGTPLADTFVGNGANNSLTGGGGDDTVDGAGGIDTAVFTGARNAYVIAGSGSGRSVADGTSGRDGTDSLTNIERLKFSDGSLALDLDGNAGKVAKILGAVFGAASIARKDFVGIGLSIIDGGMNYEDLCALAVKAAGKSTNADVVELLWSNVVGGSIPADQKANFVGLLDKGMTIGRLTSIAADTTLNTEKIGLIGLAQTGIEYLPPA